MRQILCFSCVFFAGTMRKKGLDKRKVKKENKKSQGRRLKIPPAPRKVFSQRGTAIILQIGFPLEENFSSYSVITLPMPMVLWCRS